MRKEYKYTNCLLDKREQCICFRECCKKCEYRFLCCLCTHRQIKCCERKEYLFKLDKQKNEKEIEEKKTKTFSKVLNISGDILSNIPSNQNSQNLNQSTPKDPNDPNNIKVALFLYALTLISMTICSLVFALNGGFNLRSLTC